jgi:hypothetical protein
MKFDVTLSKMPSYPNDLVQYYLAADMDLLKLNTLIGRQIKVEFLNEKYCASCGNRFADLFRMGFCKDCFFTSPQAGESIIRPELSRAHEGEEDRDLEYERAYQLQPHIVYLANTGTLKVGVTRAVQKQTRWIDQGASEAIILAETENRYQAGLIEVALKEHVSDKTPWRKMLTNQVEKLKLVEEKDRLSKELSTELRRFLSTDNRVFSFNYPVEEFPSKVKSLNLEKDSNFETVLKGIKGQYWLLDNGVVFNLRAHTGYRISLALI